MAGTSPAMTAESLIGVKYSLHDGQMAHTGHAQTARRAEMSRLAYSDFRQTA
jgi:hypothetical protein